jgi:hypothetical protein
VGLEEGLRRLASWRRGAIEEREAVLA